MRSGEASRQSRRCERGAALVETAIVASLLFLLLFGIVTFGFTLAYRQNMVQVANDAARAGAVALDDPATRAMAAGEIAASGFGKSCAADDDGLTCTPTISECPAPAAGEMCITVEVVHDNAADPIVAPLPLISMFVPSSMRTEATAIVGQGP